MYVLTATDWNCNPNRELMNTGEIGKGWKEEACCSNLSYNSSSKDVGIIFVLSIGFAT